MPAYTFIADYRGGTYICQPDASDVKTAFQLWKQHIIIGQYVPDLDTNAFVEAVDFYLHELPPLVINEVKNVWLFKFAMGRHVWEVHAVRTETFVVESEIEAEVVEH